MKRIKLTILQMHDGCKDRVPSGNFHQSKLEMTKSPEAPIRFQLPISVRRILEVFDSELSCIRQWIDPSHQHGQLSAGHTSKPDPCKTWKRVSKWRLFYP